MSIICFQETHSTEEVERLWELEWGFVILVVTLAVLIESLYF